MCYVGFGGKACELKTCSRGPGGAENCSNNGICQNGECRCFQNYTGIDCNELLSVVALHQTSQSSPHSNTICSSHGEFDYSTRQCSCSPGWTSPDCSQNENCLDKSCSKCRNGFGGLFCLDRVPFHCDSRCNQHGVCLNGTCTCSPGFHGRHCDISKERKRL